MPRTSSVVVDVPAPPEAVWAVLTDVSRVGEWSHEARTARWTRGDPGAVGSVFRGRNRSGPVRWSRPCTVRESVPYSRFVWATDGGPFGDRVVWEFDLAATATGTRITQRYRIEAMPRLLEAAVVRVLPGHRDREAALAADLVRLGEVAARPR
ncbi:MAG: SRPBCC family protein [Marmoricola sp.]